MNNKISLKKNCIGYKKIKKLEQNSIAEHLNKFFTEIRPNQARDIAPSSVMYENDLKAFHKNQSEHNLNINKPKDAFFSLKLDKNPDYNEINLNVLKL